MPRAKPIVIRMDKEIIQRHIRHLERCNARPVTIKHRRDNLQRVSNGLPVDLLKATADHLRAWQDDLRVCASSVQTYTAHVRAFYQWALDEELITADPSRRLPVPKVRRRESRPIPEPDLADALLAASYDPQLTAFLVLAAYAGLRAGEVALINRDDLEHVDSGGAFLRVHGKAGKERVVRLAPDVLTVLAPFLHHRGPIFRHRVTGRLLTANDVTRISSEHLHGIGIPFTLHRLRHRFAGRLTDLGGDLRDVQEALGHSSLSTTSLYVRASPRRSMRSVDLLSLEMHKADVAIVA